MNLDAHLRWLRSQSEQDRHSRYCLDLERLHGAETGAVPCVRTECGSCGAPTTLPASAARKGPWDLCRACMAADDVDLRLRKRLVEEAGDDVTPAQAFAAVRHAAARLSQRMRAPCARGGE